MKRHLIRAPHTKFIKKKLYLRTKGKFDCAKHMIRLSFSSQPIGLRYGPRSTFAISFCVLCTCIYSSRPE